MPEATVDGKCPKCGFSDPDVWTTYTPNARLRYRNVNCPNCGYTNKLRS